MKLRKFIIPSIFAVLLWGTLFFSRMKEPYYALEAFWITGIIFIMVALLLWVSNEGVFFIFSWGFGKIVDLFRSVPKNTLKYIEYIEAKKEKPRTPFLPTLAIGLAFFAVGLIWWLLI